jgi:hypothetical protein
MFPIEKLRVIPFLDRSKILKSVRYVDKAGTAGGDGAYTAMVLMHKLSLARRQRFCEVKKSTMLTRRGILIGLSGLMAAPAIVRVQSLMAMPRAPYLARSGSELRIYGISGELLGETRDVEPNYIIGYYGDRMFKIGPVWAKLGGLAERFELDWNGLKLHGRLGVSTVRVVGGYPIPIDRLPVTLMRT